MLSWNALLQAAQASAEFVLINVCKIRGSAPREVGAKMLVSSTQTIGTIGGGHLEYQAIEQAHSLLQNLNAEKFLRVQTPLVPKFDQCCGGHVELIFEKIQPNHCDWWQTLEQISSQKTSEPFFWVTAKNLTGRWILSKSQLENYQTECFVEVMDLHPKRVVLFGAGHVARALAQQLHLLNFDILCFDERDDERQKMQDLKLNVQCFAKDGRQAIRQLDDCDGLLIMTHSHQLDFALCEQILKQPTPFKFAGLIGSATKQRRFARQFQQQGLANFAQHIQCPIGLADLPGKSPEIIALSVAADLIQRQTQTLSPENPYAPRKAYV